MGNAGGKLGNHSRSRMRGRRHTVALTRSKSKEIVMNPLKRIRRFAAVLAGLAGALVAFGATPALAMREPPPGSGSGVSTSPAGTTAPVEVHTVVVGGMPG